MMQLFKNLWTGTQETITGNPAIVAIDKHHIHVLNEHGKPLFKIPFYSVQPIQNDSFLMCQITRTKFIIEKEENEVHLLDITKRTVVDLHLEKLYVDEIQRLNDSTALIKQHPKVTVYNIETMTIVKEFNIEHITDFMPVTDSTLVSFDVLCNLCTYDTRTLAVTRHEFCGYTHTEDDDFGWDLFYISDTQVAMRDSQTLCVYDFKIGYHRTIMSVVAPEEISAEVHDHYLVVYSDVDTITLFDIDNNFNQVPLDLRCFSIICIRNDVAYYFDRFAFHSYDMNTKKTTQIARYNDISRPEYSGGYIYFVAISKSWMRESKGLYLYDFNQIREIQMYDTLIAVETP
jgi:hypothetical protein